jgi:hypothetical protein
MSLRHSWANSDKDATTADQHSEGRVKLPRPGDQRRQKHPGRHHQHAEFDDETRAAVVHQPPEGRA